MFVVVGMHKRLETDQSVASIMNAGYFRNQAGPTRAAAARR